MYQLRHLALVVGLLSATAATAAAQGSAWIDRGYVNFNVGFETTSGNLNDSVPFRLYDENGTKTVEQNVDSGVLIDFSIGTRVWRNVSAGIGYHRGSTSSEASATASVPHPVFFLSNRSVALAASDLSRTEYGFHLQIGYMIPLNEMLDVHVTGGPSYFRLRQQVIGDITFAEGGFPFTSVNATGVIEDRKDGVMGVNAGVDITYKIRDAGDYGLGAGAFIRYTGGSGTVRMFANDVDSDVGGLQVGAGIRVRF